MKKQENYKAAFIAIIIITLAIIAIAINEQLR